MAQQLHFAPEAFGVNGRPLRLAFIVDPLPTLKAYKDSTVAMMRAAEKHGHEVYAIEATSLSWHRPEPGQPGVFGLAYHLRTRPDDHDWYRESGFEAMPLRAFDAVLMRKDPPFDTEYVTATWLLERAEAEGARVYNKPRALRDHSEKLAIAEFDAYTVPTLVSRDLNQIQYFIEAQRDVVVKPLDGMGGSQVFRIHRNDSNRNAILETLTQLGTRTIMVQHYLQQIAQGDKRILLIAGKPVPWCLARIPKAGETRGNLAAGGTGVAQELSPRDREIAEHLGPILWQRGLLIVGLDVIGEYLTEINVTSPTCMVEIRQQTGFDAAGACITALEHLCSRASA
ncbi:glutathione synthase [Azovibrio restrictus]|uniref:glutathione synthase n=1 Tax=Azovibrio restrictus TaxID=146938 RepID=UPI0026EDA1A5|nr:glutathione synthase [Azovibrio restrictus]MDD3483465.1 glutathione synthase [Azovibrio restrictus]